MKLKAFMKQTRLLEELLMDNFDATGATFAAKVISAESQLPKGIVEKLSFIANLYDGAKEGKPLSPTDLKQAGYWINAAYPYLSNGVPMSPSATSRVLKRLVHLVVLALAAFAAWYFLRQN